MSTVRTMFRSARPIFQSSQFQSSFTRSAFRTGRSHQSTAGAGTADAAGAKKSWFGALWASEVGPKTVHFWAPVMKWALVLAGVSDFYRPPEKLSLTQNFALMCTGAIWTRWCLIIRPKNIFLASVNFALGCVGVIQVGRIFAYNRSVKNETAGEQVKDVAGDVAAAAKGVKEEVKAAVSA